jgi:hypothetical protein
MGGFLGCLYIHSYLFVHRMYAEFCHDQSLPMWYAHTMHKFLPRQLRAHSAILLYKQLLLHLMRLRSPINHISTPSQPSRLRFRPTPNLTFSTSPASCVSPQQSIVNAWVSRRARELKGLAGIRQW